MWKSSRAKPSAWRCWRVGLPRSGPETVTWCSRVACARTRVLGCCPEMAEAAVHIEDFAKMLTQLEGQRLPDWIETVQASALNALGGFARNLRNDLDAVIRGLSTTWSSGVVEGRVTDIKAIKRQMGGRAGLPLLRKRVLLVAASRRPHRVTSMAAV